ncbi:MAG TPA: acetyl-CoA carboxylase carboxyl transferase subunit beta, partial [Phycisphaerae bacterium]|nr:acetyl-CoA carboxylase carboxyl transferase subunit beta [Phycisphaerae bacterium]
ETMVYRKAVMENQEICPDCNHHFRLSGMARIEQLADPGSFEELFGEVQAADPLNFVWQGKDYATYYKEYSQRTDTSDSIRTGIAYIKGRRTALGVMDSAFIMGSMGSATGERIARLVERATEESLPLILVCTSGGARMQESILSLMQMGKTAAALARFNDAGGLYIAVFIDPLTAGVLASFASLADIVVAEPQALIGFTGPRVIANTIKAELPEGFQRAEFLLEHGFIDMIVHRKDLRSELARLIDYCSTNK